MSTIDIQLAVVTNQITNKNAKYKVINIGKVIMTYVITKAISSLFIRALLPITPCSVFWVRKSIQSSCIYIIIRHFSCKASSVFCTPVSAITFSHILSYSSALFPYGLFSDMSSLDTLLWKRDVYNVHVKSVYEYSY